MKYVNQLSDDELRELYKIFTDSDAEVMSLDITRFDNSIELNGYIKIPDNENEGEFLEEVDDDYSLKDFDISVYHHSGYGYCIEEFKKFMLKKFGTDYAVDYMFSR